MTNDEVMRKALHRAFSLGQTYWHQADSESYAANKRADVTQAKFNTLVEETLAHLSARPEPQAAVSEEREAFEEWATPKCLRFSEQAWEAWNARAVLAASRQVPVTSDEVINVAQALEQKRARIIVDDVARLADTYSDPFRSGWATACEEITHRLRTEVWLLCLPPVDAASPLPVGEPRQEDGERGGGVREAALRRAGAAGLLPDPDIVGAGEVDRG